jgi:hypothetical protein
VLQDFETRFTDFTSKFWPEALLGDALLAELLGEVLLAADELELGVPFTATSSPTCEDSFEVSPVRL